ncbi:MAG TPA: hypothetical protein VN884_04655 [Candidatus Sulfotelmatobacter sp.]|jgi:hypothetical protein|nr:hypothetical protein [Candidatus Sulfotelmatobacter sp.]
MPGEESAARLRRARSASGDDLDLLIHEADAESLLALLENPNMQEAHVSRLLERLELSTELLSAVAKEGKWTSSEGVRFRLARHPRTPSRIAISMLRQLYLFDLVRLSLQPSAPTDIRRTAEEFMLTRVPHLPIGEKLTLARRGPARVAAAVLAEGHPQAVKIALSNSHLTESQILKILSKPEVPARVVTAISQHAKWSAQYNVRLALLRHPHTPVPALLQFLPDIALRDLKDALTVETLTPHFRKYIDQELTRRAEDAKQNVL